MLPRPCFSKPLKGVPLTYHPAHPHQRQPHMRVKNVLPAHCAGVDQREIESLRVSDVRAAYRTSECKVTLPHNICSLYYFVILS